MVNNLKGNRTNFSYYNLKIKSSDLFQMVEAKKQVIAHLPHEGDVLMTPQLEEMLNQE